MHRASVACALLVLIAPPAARAQVATTVSPGQRIQVRASGPYENQTLRGTVVSTSSDSVMMTLDDGAGAARIATASISRLELSRGMKRRTGAGLGRGLLAGAAGGAMVGFMACKGQRNCNSSNTEMNSPGFYMTAYGLLGAGVGGVVGAIIGSRSDREAWTPVPRERWHVQATPGSGGSVAVSASRRF